MKIMERDFTVYMLVNGSTGNYLEREFLNKKEVIEVSGITGEYDLIIKMQFSNISNYNDFLTEFRTKYSSDIKQTVTMVRTEKQNKFISYNWPKTYLNLLAKNHCN